MEGSEREREIECARGRILDEPDLPVARGSWTWKTCLRRVKDCDFSSSEHQKKHFSGPNCCHLHLELKKEYFFSMTSGSSALIMVVIEYLEVIRVRIYIYKYAVTQQTVEVSWGFAEHLSGRSCSNRIKNILFRKGEIITMVK